MRRTLLIALTIAATVVTALLASPPFKTPLTPSTFSEAASMMTRTAVIVSLLFVWIVAAIVITLMSGREIRYSSIELRASPLHCFALGLVAVTSFVLTAILFSYLMPFLVGIPLIVALSLFAILAKVYGTIVVFHAIGTIGAGARSRAAMSRRRWLRGDLAMVVIGVLLLGAIRLIPVVGPIAWGVASVFGVGTALATKFGRREPWFLAWRPADV
jgi:uncharacterized membrane protein